MTAVQSAPPTSVNSSSSCSTSSNNNNNNSSSNVNNSNNNNGAASSASSSSAGGNNNSILQYVNASNLSKIESFLNDSAYREAIENSSNYNSRLCRERRLRMPFLDSQTGVAQNHSNLFMSARERLPGLQHGQIYTYPSKRWRKKRRQYLMHYFHPKRIIRGDTEDGVDCIESSVPGANDDSKDSLALKDEHSKDAWYLDEQDMLDIEPYDEPDPDSDFDYEESYSSKRKRRKPRGGGHHPARNHPPATDSPTGKRTKGGGRGRKKVNYDASDTDKPFVCDLCSARYKTRPGLVYHYSHSHSTSSGDPAKELSPSPADVESRSVADAVATDQPGGTRRGRQSTAASSTSSPSAAAAASSSIPGSAGGCGVGGGGAGGGGGGLTGTPAPTSGAAAAAASGAGGGNGNSNGPAGSPSGPAPSTTTGSASPGSAGPPAPPLAPGQQQQQPQQQAGQPGAAQQQPPQQPLQQPPGAAESSCAAPASPTVSATVGPAAAASKDETGQHRPPAALSPALGLHQNNSGSPKTGQDGQAPGGPQPAQQHGAAPIQQHHQGNHHHAGGMDGKKAKPAQPSPYCDFCLGDARENKKTGGSEELVSCSDCGRSGKQSNNHHQQAQHQTEERVKRKYTRRTNNHN